jgi:ankyrin repeat protein
MLVVSNIANTDIIAALIKHSADVNAADRYGLTALMFAATLNGNPDVFITLLKHGADINAVDKDGRTALMFAAMLNGNPEIIALLIKHGADVNIKDHYGKNALDYAEKNPKIKNLEVFKLTTRRFIIIAPRS